MIQLGIKSGEYTPPLLWKELQNYVAKDMDTGKGEKLGPLKESIIYDKLPYSSRYSEGFIWGVERGKTDICLTKIILSHSILLAILTGKLSHP